MKLQAASKRELKRIAIGEGIGAVLTILGFVLLKRFDSSVLLGVLLGSAVAIMNFVSLCISVQKAAAKEDPTEAKLVMKSSYTRRMLFTILAVVVGMTVDAFHWLAVAIPLLIPRITILVMQLTGMYQPDSDEKEV